MNNLTISNLSYSSSVETLSDISLVVTEGESVAIIGDELSGATTLMDIIADIKSPDEGLIEMFENQISAHTKQALGYVFKGLPLSGFLTIDDIDSIFNGIYERWNRSTFYGCCHKFSIQKKATLKGFSPIMQRKLLLAIAVSHATRLLVIDHAFGDISGGMDDEIIDVISGFLAKNQLRSLVISADSISEVKDLVSSYLFIENGRETLHFSKSELETTLYLVECSINNEMVEHARYLFNSDNDKYCKLLIELPFISAETEKSKPTLHEIDRLMKGDASITHRLQKRGL
ncbi:MAG: ATP-binding cassette domain-containing protein [Oscillospiraceae bacterium]|nr:ATP-binding cassette domain-containing protein [Oscillospiraceae bacterium]